MEIRLVPPLAWTVSTVFEQGRKVMLVDGGLRIEIDPLIELPADRKAWATNHLARDVPAGSRLELIGQVDDRTRANAPMTLVTGRLRDAQDQVTEVRHLAFYVFGDRGGVVMCRLLSREASGRFSNGDLEELLRSAHIAAASPARLDELYD